MNQHAASLQTSTAGLQTSTASLQTSTAGLQIDNVTVDFPDGTGTVRALDDVSLHVAPGEVVAIVGSSGSGKSTLLNVAAGLVVPTAGTVGIGQLAMAGSDDARAALRRENLGIVFQQSNLLAPLSVLEQLLIVDHLRGLRLSREQKKQRRAEAEQLLETVGLGGMGHRRMQQLSGGQRQRVNIARALMAQPQVILADEPTAALDSTLSAEIFDLLVNIARQRNVAMLIITHDDALAARADRAVEICDGTLISQNVLS